MAPLVELFDVAMAAYSLSYIRCMDREILGKLANVLRRALKQICNLKRWGREELHVV